MPRIISKSSGEEDRDICDVPEALPKRLNRFLPKLDRRSKAKIVVQTELTLPTTGLYGYKTPERRFGTARTIEAIKEVGRIWNLRSHTPRLGIGDISKKGGGKISGHGSHRQGRDIDMDMLRNDGTETDSGRITFNSPNYSQELTQELVDLWHVNGVAGLIVIFFNDPRILGVNEEPHHDNHLHVRLAHPGEMPIFPSLIIGTYGAAVRELQRRLNFWLSSQGKNNLIVDGGLGKLTDTALVDFQKSNGLPSSGKTTSETWKILPVA
jgi:hypothetical protein